MWNESAWFALLLDAALKGTAVLAVTNLIAGVLRKHSAAVRHLVWTACAAALLALPLLTVSLPALRAPAAAALPQSPGVLFRTSVAAKIDSPSISPRVTPARPTPASPSLPNPRTAILLLWVLGAIAGLIQMAIGYSILAQARRRAATLEFRHGVAILEAPAGSMPIAFGIRRPAVFLPRDAAQWTDERRRMVLLHELAHIRRGDLSTHLLARTALCLYWWHPLAWFAWREFLKERERAADDLVLAAGERASDYAAHLLDVARTLQSGPRVSSAAIAMARRSQLEGRLLAILDDRNRRKAPSAGPVAALFAALVAVAVVAPLAALHAQDPSQQTLPADVEATIRAANSQKNHEMLEFAASRFAQLGQYDTARALMDSAVAIRKSVAGETSVAYGIGLLKIADLEQERGARKTADEFYAKAAQALGERPEAAPALLHLGQKALSDGNFADAEAHFRHAAQVDPAHNGIATMWMAVATDRAKNFDQAEILFTDALARTAGNPTESSAAMRLYANMLARQGRESEAAALRARAAQQRPPAEVGSKNAYRVSDVVSAPILIFKREPEYTEEARIAKLQGAVTLYVEVGEDGLAHNMKVLSGLGLGLDESAMRALSRWKFKPGTKNGVPVVVAASIEVNFRLL